MGVGVPTNSSENLAIGRTLAQLEFFNGILDEVRWSQIVRSADWIKLTHKKQKLPQQFLSFE